MDHILNFQSLFVPCARLIVNAYKDEHDSNILLKKNKDKKIYTYFVHMIKSYPKVF